MGSAENPDTGSMMYLESLLYRYMPGFDQEAASDEEVAIRIGHLRHIMTNEAKHK